MQIKIILFFTLLCNPFLFSQNKKIVYKSIASDCNKAIKININNNSTIYPATLPPKGYGTTEEINNTGNEFLFKEEHNSAWYLLNIYDDGELCMDIIPLDSTNDYDFILYHYSDSATCPQIIANKINPVRSNLARNNNKTTSKTGLSVSSKSEFVAQGIGTPYSKAIPVKKNEKYMLVLDNVYLNGKGHSIHFNCMKVIEISGTLTDSANKPIVAEISLADKEGNVIQQTQSNKYGRYKMNASVVKNQDYGLTIVSDGFFIDTKTINTAKLKTDSMFTDLKTVLAELKGGRKYNLGNINFYSGVEVLLPSSYPSVEALYKLMKKNKNMRIQIEGHVNDPIGSSLSTENMELSVKRAETILNYLKKKGINEKRMVSSGLGARDMLFPNPKNETEQQANRRVVIKIISINGE